MKAVAGLISVGFLIQFSLKSYDLSQLKRPDRGVQLTRMRKCCPILMLVKRKAQTQGQALA